MVFARSGGPPTLEGSIQKLEVGNQIHVHPRPIRKRAAAGTPYLVGEQSSRAILNSIVMGLYDPFAIVVPKPNDPPVLDRVSEKVIKV